MSDHEVYAGIDVSKDRLDVEIRPSGRRERVAYAARGLRRLVKLLKEEGVTLAVVEATGRLEERAASAMEQAGVPVAVANPARIRSFARSMGLEAKTDRLDAGVIAHFAAASNLEPRTAKLRPRAPKTASQERVEALADRRRQLVQMAAAEKNRLHSAPSQAVAKGIRRHLRWLEKDIEAVGEDLAEAVSEDPAIQARVELLDSAPGVGEAIATTLAVDLPELGRLSDKEIASLAGLAPFARESGKWRGKRMIRGGRGTVRAALYMAALTATKKSGELAALYSRLVDAGKPKKLARTAVARKLLVMLNAVARRGTPWQPLHP
jgi:transposase